MRFISDFTVETTDYLKKCVEWQINDGYQSEKIYLSNFINFVKTRIFSTNPIMKQVFDDFAMTPEDEQLKGMFQVCLEIVLNEKDDLKIDIQKILRTIKKIEEKHQLKPELTEEEQSKADSENKKSENLNNNQEEGPKVLIYWDFDDGSKFALEYCKRFAKEINAQISLIHFAPKGKEHILALKNLRDLVTEIFDNTSIRINASIKEIPKDFAAMVEISSTIGADFAIIGTTDISKKLNIISYTDIPVLVVQTMPNEKFFEKIIFPVDQRTEIKSNLNTVNSLSKYFKSEYFVSMPGKISVDVIKKRIENNFNYICSYLKQTGINYNEKIISTSSENETAFMAANEINADLIILLPHENVGFMGASLGNDEKNVLKKCPKTAVLFTTLKKKNATFGTGVMY